MKRCCIGMLVARQVIRESFSMLLLSHVLIACLPMSALNFLLVSFETL